MAHHLHDGSFQHLLDRLNRFPLGCPPEDALFRILAILFSTQEAELVSQLPVRSFTAATAARIWDMPESKAQKTLDGLADRALLLDIPHQGVTHYTLPPPMAGFFEFALMRIRSDIDQKALSALFHQYINLEDRFIIDLIGGAETQVGRVFVNEPALERSSRELQVLSYERASEVIRTASAIGVGLCYCRHKKQHLGTACNAPLEVCLTLNGAAESLIRHGYLQPIDSGRGLEILDQCRRSNLVQFGENVREGVNFICNCCPCCCEALVAARKFGMLHPVHTTAYLPIIDQTRCHRCKVCQAVCPVSGITDFGSAGLTVDVDRCLGCGLCVQACPQHVITLRARETRPLTPLNSAHRVVLMAIERGKLQHLLFDGKQLAGHRILSCILGVILRLPPVKQLLASRQIRSRFLEWLLSRHQAYG